MLPAYVDFPLFGSESILHEFYNIGNFMGVDAGAPTCSYAFGAVDEDHGKDGEVVLGLYCLMVLLLILYHVVVFLLEYVSCQRVQLGKNVSG